VTVESCQTCEVDGVENDGSERLTVTVIEGGGILCCGERLGWAGWVALGRSTEYLRPPFGMNLIHSIFFALCLTDAGSSRLSLLIQWL
jgi:hypothetical protein